MGIVGGRLGYVILRIIAKRTGLSIETGNKFELEDTKLNSIYGKNFYQEIEGKTIIDFGCGTGKQAVIMALNKAKKVIGIDVQERFLRRAKKLAEKYQVDERCIFTTHTNEKADLIVSKDAFEHFQDPAATLRRMGALLKPKGYIFAAFGPTWYHPYGGHAFSVFPWAHLIFTEKALIRWRSDFKFDGATRFSEIEGGLNKLTIRGFESIVNDVGFRFLFFETVPIKGLRVLRMKLFREFGSSMVRCRLAPKLW